MRKWAGLRSRSAVSAAGRSMAPNENIPRLKTSARIPTFQLSSRRNPLPVAKAGTFGPRVPIRRQPARSALQHRRRRPPAKSATPALTVI